MLKIKNLSISLSESKKEIIHDLNLEVKQGEVHLLNGNNGSGKSTLVNTIMGNPNFIITAGSISLDEDNVEKDLSIMQINQRANSGLFLANQYPMEIPGVGLTDFLRLIYNTNKIKEDKLPVFKFKRLLDEKTELINYPKHLLKRNLNEGFSGGEKKKTEILQMLLLQPKYVMLDEIDSGLDKNSVKEVFSAIAIYKKNFPLTAFIIITHYEKIHEYIKADFIHEMKDGNFIN